MENYSNKEGQQGQSGQSGQAATMDKNRGFEGLKSGGSNENQEKDDMKNMIDNAQNKMQEGKEQAGQFMCALNKQVRDNPWPVIAGVALGSFLLATLIKRSK